MGIDKTRQRDINYIVENGYQADAVFSLLSNQYEDGRCEDCQYPRDTLTKYAF